MLRAAYDTSDQEVEQVHAVHSQRCGADPRIDPLNGVVFTAG